MRQVVKISAQLLLFLSLTITLTVFVEGTRSQTSYKRSSNSGKSVRDAGRLANLLMGKISAGSGGILFPQDGGHILI
jgi:hypothetical protein